MPPNSELETTESAKQSNATGSNGGTNERRPRKKRIRLSCLECRKKKLSCDRNLPCQRCIRSGRPGRCSFETVVEQTPALNPPPGHQEQQIQSLRAEVAELKALLSEVRLTREANRSLETPYTTDSFEPDQAVTSNGETQGSGNLANSNDDVETLEVINDVQFNSEAINSEDNLGHNPTHVNNTELSDPKERSPRGFYSKHALFKFFSEIHELFPFIREIVDEWFKPLGVNLIKNKSTRRDYGMKSPSQKEITLEGLVPPKEDADVLVLFYLDHVEQLHRIVHIPTFKREYANFWIPQRPRYPAMSALILAILSISTYAFVGSADATSIPMRYRAMPAQWISACEEWLKNQSPKHRKLVHYQISCLVYIAKRVNMIGKKRWWKDTSSLVQDAILDGLHCDPPSKGDTPYMREMKRRVWNVIRELDLQNAFESGLPTLLHNIDSDVASPANLDDDDFSETSEELPTPKSLSEYTYTSYQSHSSRSWSLRLEISQRLFSTRFSKALTYDDVLRYTHEITQAIEAIPSWDVENENEQNGPRLPLLARAYLLFQLKECILALHRPYLQKEEGRFWLSETICYHTSRDILLLNRELAQNGLQSLTVLRADLLLASLSLVRITLLQPKVSSSMIITDSQSTIDLLEQCLPFMGDLYLRCCHSEPWCFVTMCGAIMVLKIHLGKETRQTAKASCARRFLDLHYKHEERQRAALPTQWHPMPTGSDGHADVTSGHHVTSGDIDLPASGWLDSNCAELGNDYFDLDIDMGGTWDIWEPREAWIPLVGRCPL
ncbi:peptide transporter ptr2 [Hypoxylon texense]